MPRRATYTYVRANLACLLEEVEAHRDVVIINRRGHEVVRVVGIGSPVTVHERSSPGSRRSS